MQKRELVLWIAIGFSLFSHLIILTHALFWFPLLHIPEDWRGQLLALLAASLAISVLQFLFASRKAKLLALVVLRILVLTVASYTLADSVFERTALLCCVVFEIIIYLDLPLAAAGSAAAIFAALVAGGRVFWMEAAGPFTPDGLLSMLFFPLLLMVLGAVLKQFHRLARERERLVDQLSRASAQLVEANIGLQDHVLRGEEQARNLERQRISRELHDTIGYTLMNIIALLKASVELAHHDLGRMNDFLQQGILQAQSGLADTRAALRALRSADTENPSIVRALDRLANAFRDTHIKVSVHFSNVPWHFGGAIDAVIYRIVQEGITNAIRHGNATEIAVYLSLDAGEIAVTISDNGCGTGEMVEGIGLAGIRERLRDFDGAVSAGNARGGFRLCARIPLRETA